MTTLTGKRWIVWFDYGSEAWSPTEAETFAEAVIIRDHGKAFEQQAVITEYVPLITQDGRTA